MNTLLAFSVGPMELLLILFIAVLLFGIPAVLLFLGIRNVARHNQWKRELREEVEALREDIRKLEDLIRSKS